MSSKILRILLRHWIKWCHKRVEYFVVARASCVRLSGFTYDKKTKMADGVPSWNIRTENNEFTINTVIFNSENINPGTYIFPLCSKVLVDYHFLS